MLLYTTCYPAGLGANLNLLLRLLTRPAAAMSEILDRGSLLFACLAAVGTSLLVSWTAPFSLPFSFYTPLLILAAVYVPGVLLLASLIGRVGSVGVLFSRDYAPMLTCTAMAWAAVTLPIGLVSWWVPIPELWFGLGAAACLYFAVLMFLAVRTVSGTGNGAAAVVVSFSWVPLLAVGFFLGPLQFLLRLAASPFFILFAIYYLGSEFTQMGVGLRRQQSLRRMLEAAAVNPHDGEAQYQIGLIQQQRRRYSEAIERFQAAVRIDPTETDAHFQLGRIAFLQKRYEDALGHFQTAQKQDDKHSQHEVHRELGATYLMLGRREEARRELETYAERRAYDPQGLYYYGRVLEESGERQRAREVYLQAVEAARTAPRYRRRVVAEWSRLSQRAARKLA